ncbi:stage II sporulation protein R [Lihuaxuella thermophila]|uniref:Stage II sporulation protein R n=1 Tax=Lihuaxuella thermophila TaxID=1173111 RepID=A0A1H8BBS5_9BACL|nr:stage II sporulation protein R [Lihuaxuella thermophila]SEM80335.1 stage II sporulation protein R [Lihuaxuella thermophila]
MKAGNYLLVILFIFCAWLVYSHPGTDDRWLVGEASGDVQIPDQAIRLRILANSDRGEDQWLKRKVRDEVVKEMETWVKQPRTITEARQAIKQHLPRFEQIAEETVARNGFHYPVKVDFGLVPFPTKLYGDKVYPAGNYEALRITLGEGKGDNWWCVLFPPLCFVDMSNGDAVPKENQKTLSASIATSDQAYAAQLKQEKKNTVEVRFLILEQLNHLFK